MSSATPARGARRWGAELALLADTLIWGSTFVVVKSAIQGVSPLLFLALRFSLATAVLVSLYRPALGGALHRGRSLRAGILAGCFLFGGFAFQTFGLRLTSPAKSGFITGLSIPSVPLILALIYRIPPRRLEVAGVLCATSGLALLTLQAQSLAIGRGDLLTLLCALSFGAHIVILGHYAGTAGFELLAVMQVSVCALLSLASFWWFEPPFIEWRVGVLAAVIFTGLVATALAFTLQAWAQQYTTPTRTALILALEPVFAWITSFLATGEMLSLRAGVGAVLILAGILLVELKPGRVPQHPSR